MNTKKMFYKIYFIISLLLLSFSQCIKTYADDLDTSYETFYEPDNIIETSTNEVIPNINARSAIVIDRESKTTLYGKNENKKVKMASTTKIMTATIIIENCDLNQTIEISKKAAGTGGSRLGLKTGDKITIIDLLYGLMLCSGNDAAVALAEYCAGSIPEFSNLMNNKAIELGLLNTHFESPHGLDSDEHYTTALELALLSNYALNNPTFFNIVGTKAYTITINGYPKTISNTNELLGSLNGIYGIKTGFTNGANRCLVTACKRDSLDVICVVLGCDTKKFRTQDSIKLIEYAFKNFEIVDIYSIINNNFETWKKNNSSNFYINKGLSNNLTIKLSDPKSKIIPILKKEKNNLHVDINCNQNFESPIYKDISIGYLTLKSQNDIILKLDILTNNTIEKKKYINYLQDFFWNFPKILESLI